MPWWWMKRTDSMKVRHVPEHENQIKEIIHAAACSVFFIDEDQRVTLPGYQQGGDQAMGSASREPSMNTTCLPSFAAMARWLPPVFLTMPLQ